MGFLFIMAISSSQEVLTEVHRENFLIGVNRDVQSIASDI